MQSPRVFCLAVATVLAIAGCGGGSGSNTTPAPSPAPPPTPSGNPCASVSLEVSDDVPRPATDAELAKRNPVICRYQPHNVHEALWKHEAARQQGARPAAEVQTASEDIGDIAVLQDDGSIMIPANAFDLKGTGLVLSRNQSGGYDVRQGDATFKPTLGTKVTLVDDQSATFSIPFSASFFGKSYASAFVNSDGNVTFEQADFASTDRSVTRFLSGPPRVALHFADLDPSAGGGVYVNTQADFFTVTWCKVPGFEDKRTVTAQIVVQRDGQVELKVADTTTLTDAIVGLSPGGTTTYSPVDLTRSSSGTVSGGAGAVGERFIATPDIDLVALGQLFYRTHPDDYDQLVIWADQVLISNAFAYETTVSNQIRGIGDTVYDVSREFGSAGRLSSLAYMDDINKYPSDPAVRFAGENSALGLIGHESGHRWLVLLRFNGPNGRSGAWLGRDEVHWSFFMDSDASFVEGNDIEDLGGCAFRTVAAVERYSALDQYAMGLRTEAEVPPVFYVDSPTNVPGNRDNASNPRVGIAFNGTRRNVLIQDVVSAMGQRVPGPDQAPRLHRQAFIFVVSQGKAIDRTLVDRIDRFRRAWEPFFQTATDGRMRVDTRLRP